MNAESVSHALVSVFQMKHHAYTNYFQVFFTMCHMVTVLIIDTMTSQVMDGTAEPINLLNLDFQRQK